MPVPYHIRCIVLSSSRALFTGNAPLYIILCTRDNRKWCIAYMKYVIPLQELSYCLQYFSNSLTGNAALLTYIVADITGNTPFPGRKFTIANRKCSIAYVHRGRHNKKYPISWQEIYHCKQEMRHCLRTS